MQQQQIHREKLNKIIESSSSQPANCNLNLNDNVMRDLMRSESVTSSSRQHSVATSPIRLVSSKSCETRQTSRSPSPARHNRSLQRSSRDIDVLAKAKAKEEKFNKIDELSFISIKSTSTNKTARTFRQQENDILFDLINNSSPEKQAKKSQISKVEKSNEPKTVKKKTLFEQISQKPAKKQSSFEEDEDSKLIEEIFFVK